MLVCTLLLFGLSACASRSSSQGADVRNYTDEIPAEGKAILYVFTRSFFLDAKRQHMLEFDSKAKGELTDENYYKLEVWPGDYQLAKVVAPTTFLGMFMQGFDVGRRNIRISKPGEIYAFAFNTNGTTEFTYLKNVLGEISQRKMAKFFSATENARVKRLGGSKGKWDGPSKGYDAHGVGTATFPGGIIYRGRVDENNLTAEGRLEYPDGSFYKGEYSTTVPEGLGLLADKDNQVIFAGQFYSGEPFNGARIKEGKPVIAKYRNGQKLETDPAVLAEQEISKRDAKTLESVGQTSRVISNKIEQIKAAKYSADQEFEQREAEYPERCACTFKLCLSSGSSSDTAEERRAYKKAISERDQACRKWYRSGATRASRQVTLERDLAASDLKLSSLLSEYKQAEQRDADARRQKAAELESSRNARLADARRKLEEQQAKNLAEQRESCKGKEDYCGCYAFMPKERQQNILTCSK